MRELWLFRSDGRTENQKERTRCPCSCGGSQEGRPTVGLIPGPGQAFGDVAAARFSSRRPDAAGPSGWPQEQQTLPKEMVVAACFHDAGRQAEGKDLWDRDSAELCRNYLRRTSRQTADHYFEALANKDPRDRSYLSLEHACIHDADCLEIVRFRGPRRDFRFDNLACWNLPAHHAAKQPRVRETLRKLKEEWASVIDYVQQERSDINGAILADLSQAYTRYWQVLKSREAASKWPVLTNLLAADLRA